MGLFFCFFLFFFGFFFENQNRRGSLSHKNHARHDKIKTIGGAGYGVCSSD